MIFATNEKYKQAILSTLIHIQTHLEADLNLDMLAEHVGFSVYHFHRIFREVIGEPVKEYVRRLRLERAAYRLKVSEETILRIALGAGFKTHESFTRAFQRQFGITPNKFRKDFLQTSRARKKQIQLKYIADFNMKDESGLLPNGSTSTNVRLEHVRLIIVAFIMSGFNLTEWISRSPKEVFDFISASENAPKIVPSVTSMVKLTEGPVGVGTRYRETRMMKGKEEHSELAIVEFEPTIRYTMKNVTEGVETIYRYNLHPEENGTRIDLVCEVTASGVKKLMVPMVVSILKKEDGDHLQRLKKAMEN